METSTIRAAVAGDPRAQQCVAEDYWDELHSRAVRVWRQWRLPSWIGQPTQCVNDALLRVFSQKQSTCVDRRHFRATVHLALGRVFVDLQRRADAEKRGGPSGRSAVPLDDIAVEPDHAGSLDARELFARLAREDPEGVRMLEMHFLEERTQEEIAALLLLTRRTVQYRLKRLVARLGREFERRR